MAGQRSKLQEDVRFRVLRLLHDNPQLSQRDLAVQVGISMEVPITCFVPL